MAALSNAGFPFVVGTRFAGDQHIAPYIVVSDNYQTPLNPSNHKGMTGPRGTNNPTGDNLHPWKIRILQQLAMRKQQNLTGNGNDLRPGFIYDLAHIQMIFNTH